jgi:tetratricopeptide (TPR) repeat protein
MPSRGWHLPAMAVMFLCAAAWPARAMPPQDVATSPVHLAASPQLFAVVGALYAAGFDRAPDVPSDDPLVTRFRALQGPATEELRNYLRNHSGTDSASTITRYITFALVAGPPPKFEITTLRAELPPDVLELDGFRDVLANFYQESKMDALWREYQPRYQQSEAQLREPLTRSVLSVSGYLRDTVSPTRSFTVYVEPLVGGQIHVRNVGEEYALVVNPSVNALDEMRHAFLHFMLDPLVIQYRDKLVPEDPMFQAAQRAPRLAVGLRRDSLAFFAECLVHAVELRMRKLPPAQLAAEVDRAEGDGLVMVRSLMPALAKFEKSEPAMSFYFPDLLKSIDAASERSRVETIRFPAVEAPAAPEPAAPGAVKSEKDLALDEGDRLTAARDASGAAAAYERALAIAPNDPHALYGDGVASLLLGQGQQAFDLFTQVASAASATDPAARPDGGTLAWAHIYLGRLHDLAGERDQAVAEYQAALAVAGAPDTAHAPAQKGVDEPYQPAARNP